MSMPTRRVVNMTMGTHRGLTFWDLGTGGVYRPVAFGVTRPDVAGAPRLALFDFGLAIAEQ